MNKKRFCFLNKKLDALVISVSGSNFVATSINNKNTSASNNEYCSSSPVVGDYLAYKKSGFITYCVQDSVNSTNFKYVCVYYKDA